MSAHVSSPAVPTPHVSSQEVSTPEAQAHRGLHRTLWVIQVFLAIAFGIVGFMKITVSVAELGHTMAWVKTAPEFMVRFIGVAELLGAVGLVAPGFTGIRPWLTPLAAACLTIVMALAIGFHLWRGELMFAPPPLILGSLTALVAWGRFRKVPLAEWDYW
jgi:hypothetical protein